MTERRQYVLIFRNMLGRLQRGEQIKFERLVPDTKLDPVADRLLDKIGYLEGSLPTRVVEFDSVLQGIRFDLIRLAEGEFNDNPAGAAAIIEGDLQLWDEFEPKARLLVRDLITEGNRRPRWVPDSR